MEEYKIGSKFRTKSIDDIGEIIKKYYDMYKELEKTKIEIVKNKENYEISIEHTLKATVHKI